MKCTMANAQVNLSFLENGRGGFYPLHAGYKFRYNQRTYWRCVHRQCPATVTTRHILVNVFVGLAAESFISDVRKRCREVATPISSIYDEELGGLRNTDCDEIVVDMIRQVPTFQAC